MEISRTRKIALLIIVTTAVLLSGTWAYAQVANGSLAACVSKDGDTRFIIPGFTSQTCKRGEQRVTWNITGAQGPKGDKGDTGSAGLQGLPGSNGTTGPQGIQGMQGATGTPGVTGEKGEKGDTGPQGLSGGSLHLYDGNNQDLGILIDADILKSSTTTPNESNNYSYYLSEYRTYIPSLNVVPTFVETWALPTVNGSLQRKVVLKEPEPVPTFRAHVIYFDQTGCQGTPYGIRPIGPSQSIESVRFSGGITRYFHSTTEDLTTQSPQSLLLGSFDIANAQCYDNIEDAHIYPTPTRLLRFEEVSLPFSEPLAWPLRVASN